jgi:hypothetical protein
MECIIKKYKGRSCSSQILLGIVDFRYFVSHYWPVVAFCEHGNEPKVSVKGRKILDQISDYWLLKKDSAPWSWLADQLATQSFSQSVSSGSLESLVDFTNSL